MGQSTADLHLFKRAVYAAHVLRVNLLEVLWLDPAENEITATDTSNISKLFLGVKLQDLKGFQYLSIKPVNELSFR